MYGAVSRRRASRSYSRTMCTTCIMYAWSTTAAAKVLVGLVPGGQQPQAFRCFGPMMQSWRPRRRLHSDRWWPQALGHDPIVQGMARRIRLPQHLTVLPHPSKQLLPHKRHRVVEIGEVVEPPLEHADLVVPVNVNSEQAARAVHVQWRHGHCGSGPVAAGKGSRSREARPALGLRGAPCAELGDYSDPASYPPGHA